MKGRTLRLRALFAAIITAVATVPAPARRAFLAGTRHIDGDGAALKVLVVKLLDGLLRLRRRVKFHEGEAAGFARHLVQHQVDGFGRPRLGEVGLKIIFLRLKREVAYKQSVFIHNVDAQKTKWEEIGRASCRE